MKQHDNYSSREVKATRKGFRFASRKNEAERIGESIKYGAIFDCVPRPPEVQFRKRAAHQDIVPPLRFQPRNNAERVLDYINKRGISQLQSLKVLDELRFALNCKE